MTPWSLEFVKYIMEVGKYLEYVNHHCPLSNKLLMDNIFQDYYDPSSFTFNFRVNNRQRPHYFVRGIEEKFIYYLIENNLMTIVDIQKRSIENASFSKLHVYNLKTCLTFKGLWIQSCYKRHFKFKFNEMKQTNL